jgi:hypothetical protein
VLETIRKWIKIRAMPFIVIEEALMGQDWTHSIDQRTRPGRKLDVLDCMAIVRGNDSQTSIKVVKNTGACDCFSEYVPASQV